MCAQFTIEIFFAPARGGGLGPPLATPMPQGEQVYYTDTAQSNRKKERGNPELYISRIALAVNN